MSDTQGHPSKPLKIGLIGGTGLADALAAEQTAEAGGRGVETVHPDTPFGKPSSPIVQTRWAGVDICIIQRHGPGHVYNPSTVPYRANVFALKALGCTHVLASGATGSLREAIAPGHLVIVDQIIDKTHRRESTFYDAACGAAVHTELSEPCCPVMRTWLIESAEAADHDLHVHDGGTYVCMEGPAFSTKAESEMHRQWGGDLIGMTAMPEARLAREAELPYALIGLPTDYDCWRPHDPTRPQHELLNEIIGNLKQASANAIALIQQALKDPTPLTKQPCLGEDALKLAIWTDKTKIPPERVERLRPLWGRYFER